MMPFLGPAVAVWITVGSAVMAYYYLVIARPRPDKSVREPELPDPRPRWGSRWGDPPPAGPARSESVTGYPTSALPAYDMENYPTDRWTAST